MALALAACGGGGGGGDNGPVGTNPVPNVPPPPPPSSTGLNVSFDKSALSFEYKEGDTPNPQIVIGKAGGDTTRDVLMGAEINGKGIAAPIKIVVDPAARTGTITVVPERGLAAGTYTGSIRMLACATQDCSVQHGGSPHTVAYTITVRSGLKPSATSLSMAAVESGASSPATITFTPPAPNASVTAQVNYLNGLAGWLSAQIVGTSLQVQASAASLVAGNYEANVLLSAPSSGQTVSIPVRLTVGNGLTVAEQAAVKIDNSVSARQLQGSIMMSLAPGASATTWTATSDQPWLKLASSSGSFDTQPAWTIDTAAFAGLANNTRHIAKVRITTNSNLPARTYTLDVHKALAEIKGLDALALLAGQSGDVLVYGNGFSSLAAGLDAVSVNGVQPTAASVVDDKVLRISLPAMQAGRYTVTLKSASGLSTAGKQIVVTGRDTYTYQALDTQGKKSVVVWDAASKSAFVLNTTLKSVMRYASVNGRFQLVTTRSFPAVNGIGMSPDHGALVLQAGYGTIHKLSPTDLSTLATFTLSPYADNGTVYFVPLSIMGDNRLLHEAFGWVDLDTGAVSPASSGDTYVSFSGAAGWGAVSGNGMRMIRPDSGRYSPSGPMMHTDVSSGKFVPYKTDLPPHFYYYAVNHEGTVWDVGSTVVDFDLNVRGRVTLPDGWYSGEGAMSRDGTRLYRYAQSASQGVKPRVYVFDTSRTLATTVNLPIVGYFEFADLPNCFIGDGYPTDTCSPNTSVTISDDGNALFIVGDRKFVVVPIPPEMAPTGASQTMSRMSGRAIIPAIRR